MREINDFKEKRDLPIPMEMTNRSFARWTAPFVGVACGLWVVFLYASKEGQAVSTGMLLTGVILGGVAGLLILIAHPSGTDTSDNRGSLAGRMFAVASVPLGLVPFLGLLIGPIAVFLNRRVSGWPKVASWIGAVIALLFTTVAFIGITMSRAR